MPRLLQIAHDHLSPAGAVADRFVERGYDIAELLVVPEERFVDPGVEFDFPDPTGYDAVMLLGAPWSAYDDAVASWVTPELELLRDADRAGVPVLGICFGGQLLATAHGGRVHASAAPEIGWHLVHSDDSVLDGAWFQWHYDRWVTPADAVELARNAAASQVFVLRRNLALQFHPEVDAAGLKGWLEFGGHRQAKPRVSIPTSSFAIPRRWAPMPRLGPAGWWIRSLTVSRSPRTTRPCDRPRRAGNRRRHRHRCGRRPAARRGGRPGGDLRAPPGAVTARRRTHGRAGGRRRRERGGGRDDGRGSKRSRRSAGSTDWYSTTALFGSARSTSLSIRTGTTRCKST